MLIEYIKALGLSLYPFSYHDFCRKKAQFVIKYFLFIVFVGLILSNILMIPIYATLPDVIMKSLKMFTTFNITNEVVMTAPIELPKKDAMVVIDTTGTIKEIKNERVIITKDYVYYRLFFAPKRVSLDKLLNVAEYPYDTTWLLISILVLLFPSLLFYAYFFLLLKYFILIALSSFILYFIVRVLLLYEISFKNAMHCGFYAGTVFILLEAIVVPLNSQLLFPLFSLWGLTFYAVSYLIFFVFGIICTILVEKDITLGKKKQHEEE